MKTTTAFGLIIAAMALVAMPSASANVSATHTSLAEDNTGCYGYYNYEQKRCYGVNETTVNELLCIWQCTGDDSAALAGPASDSSLAALVEPAGFQPAYKCYHVLSPFIIYNPTTGQPLYTQPYNYSVCA